MRVSFAASGLLFTALAVPMPIVYLREGPVALLPATAVVTLALCSWILVFALNDSELANRVRLVFRSALLWGTTGFLVGFLGAVMLRPDSPGAPLVAFVATGPLAALAGAALAWVSR